MTLHTLAYLYCPNYMYAIPLYKGRFLKSLKPFSHNNRCERLNMSKIEKLDSENFAKQSNQDWFNLLYPYSWCPQMISLTLWKHVSRLKPFKFAKVSNYIGLRLMSPHRSFNVSRAESKSKCIWIKREEIMVWTCNDANHLQLSFFFSATKAYIVSQQLLVCGFILRVLIPSWQPSPLLSIEHNCY